MQFLYQLLLLLHLEALQVDFVLKADDLGLVLEHDVVSVDELARTRLQLVVQDGFLVEDLPVLTDALLVPALSLQQLSLLGLRGLLSRSLQDLVAHVVDSLGQLPNDLILVADLCEETLDLLEGGAADQLIHALSHLADALLEVHLPVLAHQRELLFQCRRSILRCLDIRVQLLNPIVILVIVMHLPQCLLILNLVLYGLCLDPQLSDLLVDSTQLFDDALVGHLPIKYASLNVGDSGEPVFARSSLLLADTLGLLLDLPEHLLALLSLHLQLPVLSLHAFQLAFALTQLLVYTHTRLLNGLQQVLGRELALLRRRL